MKKVILALLLIILLPLVACSDDRFVYVGLEANGNRWYVDKTNITKDTGTGVINCCCWVVFSSQYHKDLIYNALNSSQKEQDIANRATGVLVYQKIDTEKRTFSNSRIDFYDKNGKFLKEDTHRSNAWHTIPPTSMVDATLALINGGSLPVTKTSSKTVSYDTRSIVFTALIGGVTIIALLLGLYTKFSPTTPSNSASQQNTHQTGYGSDSRAEYDFDYPYEDIGKVTGM